MRYLLFQFFALMLWFDVRSQSVFFDILTPMDSLVSSKICFNNDRSVDRVREVARSKPQVGDGYKKYPGDKQKYFIYSRDSSEYALIWSGPDLGLGWFYSFGRTNKKRCRSCGICLGVDTADRFIIGPKIALGSKLNDLRSQVLLDYYRTYAYKSADYYYYEFGHLENYPNEPRWLIYYKFNSGVLVEIGVGRNMPGINPMLN